MLYFTCSNITTTAASGKAAYFPAPNSLCDARHLPTSTHRAIHRCQATEKKKLSCQDMQHTNKDMSRYATHQQRQRHHNLQLASVAATVLSTNTMMRWRSTTQLPVPLQYHHHQRVPKAAQQASPSQTCKHGNVPMSMKQVSRRIPTMLDVAFKNTSNLF